MTQLDTQHLTDKQRYWLKHIQACQASGISIKDYAEQQGIQIKSLYYWKKTLVKKGVLPRSRKPRIPAVTFQRAQVMDKNTADSQWKIHLPNGIQVGLTGTVNEAELSLVLKTVTRLS